MGQPLNQMLHMLCTDNQSSRLLFSCSFLLIARGLAYRIRSINPSFRYAMNMKNINLCCNHLFCRPCSSHKQGEHKLHYWLTSTKTTSFSTAIIISFCLRLSEKRHKMAQMVSKILSLD